MPLNSIKKRYLMKTLGLVTLSSFLMGADASEKPSIDNSCNGLNEAKVINPWLRKILPVQKSTALYFELTNHSNCDFEISDIKVEYARMAMFHKTTEDNGVTKMKHQHSIIVRANSKVVFKPNDLHVMVMGFDLNSVTDNRVKVELLDNNRNSIEFYAPIQEGK